MHTLLHPYILLLDWFQSNSTFLSFAFAATCGLSGWCCIIWNIHSICSRLSLFSLGFAWPCGMEFVFSWLQGEDNKQDTFINCFFVIYWSDLLGASVIVWAVNNLTSTENPEYCVQFSLSALFLRMNRCFHYCWVLEAYSQLFKGWRAVSIG